MVFSAVGRDYMVRVHHPVTAAEWWRIGLLALGWVGMLLLQMAVWRGKPRGLVRPRHSLEHGSVKPMETVEYRLPQDFLALLH